MLASKDISMVIISFLLVGFLFLAFPNNGYSGLPLGCCTSLPNGTTNCIGCEGLDCAIRDNLCESPNNYMGATACVNDGGGAQCISVSGLDGCCINMEDNCLEEGLDIEQCALDNDGLAWFPGISCSEVPQCQNNIVSVVPTLSPWALIAVVILLAVIGYFVIRTRKLNT